MIPHYLMLKHLSYSSIDTRETDSSEPKEIPDLKAPILGAISALPLVKRWYKIISSLNTPERQDVVPL